jgi:hypothetical protein
VQNKRKKENDKKSIMEGNKDKMICRQEKDNNMARRKIKERKVGLKKRKRESRK